MSDKVIRPFTKSDWMALEGAEGWGERHKEGFQEPLILQESDIIEVVVAQNVVEVYFWGSSEFDEQELFRADIRFPNQQLARVFLQGLPRFSKDPVEARRQLVELGFTKFM